MIIIYLAVQNVPLERIESIFGIGKTDHCMTMKTFHNLLKVCWSSYLAMHGGTGKAFSHAKMYENIELLRHCSVYLLSFYDHI